MTKNDLLRRLIAVLFASSFGGTTVTAAEDENPTPSVALTPGKTLYLEFPQLGDTWKDQPTRAGVYLPTDYSPDESFPLLVWFGGGSGSDTPKKAVKITEGKGFVCVALPYRSETDSDEGERMGGWQTPWSFYEPMLARLATVVPNIDPKRRVCGGFSSGGAAILYQIGNSDEAFQQYFHAFMPSGAGWPMGGLDTLKGRPMLASMGEKDKRLPNYRKLQKAAIEAEIDFTLLIFEGSKHGMPSAGFPKIRTWLKTHVVDRGISKP